MKFSTIFLSTAVLADEARDSDMKQPLTDLHHLVKLSHELLDNFYDFLPSKNLWKKKFEHNAVRMRKDFRRGEDRCGVYDRRHKSSHLDTQKAHNDQKRMQEVTENLKLSEDSVVATQQLTTAFRRWTIQNISKCSGPNRKTEEIELMKKWNLELQHHLELQGEHYGYPNDPK